MVNEITIGRFCNQLCLTVPLEYTAVYLEQSGRRDELKPALVSTESKIIPLPGNCDAALISLERADGEARKIMIPNYLGKQYSRIKEYTTSRTAKSTSILCHIQNEGFIPSTMIAVTTKGSKKSTNSLNIKQSSLESIVVTAEIDLPATLGEIEEIYLG
jgi:hypothetical protein